MNNAFKVDLQALGVSNRSTIIMSTKKVICKHNQVKNFQNKANALLKRVESFKNRFADLLKKGLPSFWDNIEYLFSQETYHALLAL